MPERYSLALATFAPCPLSSENARAKIGCGSLRLRPGYSIHFDAPQSLRSRRPISQEAARLHGVTSPRELQTRTCHTTAWRDSSSGPSHSTSVCELERTLPESHRYAPLRSCESLRAARIW